MIANLSNIQHFSTGDGPGIRTTVFLKGCDLKCPWCHNPETKSPEQVELVYKATGKRVLYGIRIDTDEIIREVLNDKIFYAETGGGCTLSGGEAMLQPDVCTEIAAGLREKGVSTLIDTAGCVKWSAFEKVLPYVDTYYFDVKTADPIKARDFCGADSELIFDNLSRLVNAGKDVTARIPLIPGFNPDVDSQKKIIERILPLGVKKVGLLPFHRLGSAKYEAMGLEYAYADTQPPEKNVLSELKALYEQNGFSVNIE